MQDRPSIAVLGTGIMGGAMAGRWVDQGFAVTVWNRNRTKAERVGDKGATVAATPAEAVARADVVVTMLADGDATAAVMGGALPAVPPGAVWVQMGTVGIDATASLAALAADAGVAFVDAPVAGTRAPAEQGQLTVLASGPDELRPRCDAAFEAVAARVMWVGGAGSGTRLKLVVNAWLAALLAGLAEAIALAEGIGVDPRQFLAAIEGGPIGPAYASIKGTMMIERSYPPSFPLDLLAKDVDLLAEAADDARVDLRLPAAIRELLAAARDEHGDDDMSALVEALRT